MRIRWWIGLPGLLPMLALAAEPAPAPTTTPVVDDSGLTAASLDLKNFAVQEIVRAAAAAQSEASPPQTAAADAAKATVERLPELRFRAPRRVHHQECDSFNCVAYTADDEPLFSVPRDQAIQALDGAENQWLACQQIDDMLSTFDRVDKCRGISIGLPSSELPGLRL
jgi:hypothetical protein